MQTQNNTITESRKTQKYLGSKGLIFFIAFLGTFIPMSTDLYLPALPGMAAHFEASVNLVNLTLILFFVFYSAGMLFWGPLSDKYGRKPILLIGLTLYAVASLLCVFSGNIYQLIAFRILQAIGGGGVTAVETAIVKDVYEGRKRETVLAVVQSMIIIAPIVAPVLGAFLLSFTSWQGIFWTLAGFGLLAMVGGFMFQETLDTRYTGNALQVITRLGVVLKNPGFTSLLVTFSLAGIPMMAFVAASSYIYIDGFGLSEQAYSYFFAANAVCALLGPFLYIQLSKQFKRRSLIIVGFAVTSASGVLIAVLGSSSPWLFALTVIPASIAGSMIRPPSTNLMLEQQQEDTGSAASLMSSFGILIASMGMLLISFDWSNRILVLGALYFIIGMICGMLWMVFSTKPFVKQLQHLPDAQ